MVFLTLFFNTTTCSRYTPCCKILLCNHHIIINCKLFLVSKRTNINRDLFQFKLVDIVFGYNFITIVSGHLSRLKSLCVAGIEINLYMKYRWVFTSRSINAQESCTRTRTITSLLSYSSASQQAHAPVNISYL